MLLDKGLDTYSKCDKVLLVEDFNTEILDQRIESFLYINELCNIVKKGNLFQNYAKSTLHRSFIN